MFEDRRKVFPEGFLDIAVFCQHQNAEFFTYYEVLIKKHLLAFNQGF